MSKIQTAEIGQFLGLKTDCPAEKCPEDYSPDCSDMMFSVGGMATRFPFRQKVTMPAEIVWKEEFLAKSGLTEIVALDVNGILYSVSPAGVYAIIDMIAPGSSVNSVVAYGRIYMSFFNANGGCDAPRQWDGKNLYRVSQGGPGAAPSFTPVADITDRYPITSINQPGPQNRTSSYFLQSTGPGDKTDAGNVVTIYYSDSDLAGPDAALVAAFNSGNPVYLYVSFTGGPQVQGPYTVQVTGVGLAAPPDQPRPFYYFTYNLPSSDLTYYQGSGNPGFTANYQQSIATVITSQPVPGVSVGSTVTITGSSIDNYDSNWPISQTTNSGTLGITQTELSGGIATYSYTVTSGVPPVAGQTITIIEIFNGPLSPVTGTSVLNVINGVIATASGGNSGTFTIIGFPAGIYPAAAESGLGTTAGTEFLFDPGATTVGTSTSPIYGNATGGFLIFNSSTTDVVISTGLRQAVVFFITQTALTTQLSPIAKFTVPSNTTAITVEDLPIGPANVTGRGVAFTAANGSKFFYLLIPQQVGGIITGTATVVNDNISSSATFSFNDLALVGGQAIDIPGNNLFAQVPLNLPAGVTWYEDRLFWLGERNVVINLLNLGMDGGTLSGSTVPLGWRAAGNGQIQQLGFMPAYVVTGPDTGGLSQGAATDTAGNAILQPILNYSLRFWVAQSAMTGMYQAKISSVSTGFASAAFYDLSTVIQSGYVTMNFSLPMPAAIPSDLTLSTGFVNLVGTAKIRDQQMIFADNPNRNPIARPSYVKNPEAYDSVTGNVGPNDDPTALVAMFKLQESLYFLTQRALYGVESIGNSEPSSWDPYQVSDKCGGFNSNCVTTAKGWDTSGRPWGAFWHAGGLPEKTSATIAPTWRGFSSINCVQDDPDFERVYFSMVGPNGNSILVYDYHEIGLGGSGKWCPWNRPANWIDYSSIGATFVFGADFYQLDTTPGIADDNLGPIGGYYTLPPLGVSMFQKSYSYFGLRITGTGVLTPFMYSSTLSVLTQALYGQDLAALIDTVAEWDQNIRGRLLFMKIGQPGVQFSLSDATILFQIDPNSPVSGAR